MPTPVMQEGGRAVIFPIKGKLAYAREVYRMGLNVVPPMRWVNAQLPPLSEVGWGIDK